MFKKTDVYIHEENGINLFIFRIQKYAPKSSTEFRTYDGYLKIFHVLSGTAVWKIENKEYPVKKDDILILNNVERRQLIVENETEPFVIEYAQFLPFFLFPNQNCALPFFFREDGFNHLHTQSDDRHTQLLTVFRTLSKAVSKPIVFKKEYVYALLLQLVTIFGEIFLSKKQLSSFARNNNLQLYQKICKITEYVTKHPEKRLSEEEIAKKFHISKHYLSRSFKAYNGVNYPTFLKTIRIGYACNLIKNGAKTVADAAFASGFGSLSAFYAAFKQVTGYSPKKYFSA